MIHIRDRRLLCDVSQHIAHNRIESKSVAVLLCYCYSVYAIKSNIRTHTHTHCRLFTASRVFQRDGDSRSNGPSCICIASGNEATNELLYDVFHNTFYTIENIMNQSKCSRNEGEPVGTRYKNSPSHAVTFL